MPYKLPHAPQLSDLMRTPTDRRAFLAKASAIGVGLPGLGASPASKRAATLVAALSAYPFRAVPEDELTAPA